MAFLRYFVVFLVMSFAPVVQAAGLVVNEATNGPDGVKEYVELVTIGDAVNPAGSIDLSGWIFDDNNGEFGSGTGQGISRGYMRFNGSCTGHTAVPIGSIIVLYNVADPNPSLPADDPTDTDMDGVYVLPSDSSCLDRCQTSPRAGTGDTSYSCTTQSGNWQNRVGFRNPGDVAQVRRPDTSFFQGFSYGDRPPGLSFNVDGPGTGRQKVFYFTCGDYNSNLGSDNGPVYFSNSVTPGSIGETPGFPNSVTNAFFLNAVKNGTFDYADPQAFCSVSTPITLGYFKAERGVNAGDVVFTWQTVTEVGNLGFNLYAHSETKGWQAVNDRLIPSQPGDSVATLSYSYAATGITGRLFALGDMDVFGKETLHGPFPLDAVQGLDRSQRKETDWPAIKAEHKARRNARKAERQQRLEQNLHRKLGDSEQKMRQYLERQSDTRQ